MTEKQEAADGNGSSRRNLLKTAGLTAAAIGASQLVGQSAASAAAGGTASTGVGSTASSSSVQLDVVDFVDGHYVIEARAQVAGTGLSAPLRMRDGLKIELTTGRATITEDPYTGEILVKPSVGDEIAVRAVVPSNTAAARVAGVTSSASVGSDSTTIATYAGALPSSQASVALAGGGACAAAANLDGLNTVMATMTEQLSAERKSAVAAAASGTHYSQLRVRAAVMGNVIPFSDTHREIRWRHARYYGTDEVLGLLRFTYQQGKPSRVTMDSRGGAEFFPADAQNTLYCRMELLDLGAAAISHDPMIFPNTGMNWPVYAKPMHLAQPVKFFDEAAPDREIFTIVENELALYDYNGVTIKTLGSKVHASGVLKSAFQVTNQTQSPFTGRWMMIGDHTDSTFASTDKPLTLGPAGSRSATTVVEVSAPIQKRILPQRVAFAVMSLSDPVVLGITPLTFKFPSA